MRTACGMRSSSLLRSSCSWLPSKGITCSSVRSVGDFGKIFAGGEERLGVRTSGSRLPCVSISGEHSEVTRCTSPCFQTRVSFSEAEAVTSPELDMATSPEAEEVLSQATLIWRVMKLPLYSVAVIPLTVGAAAAYLQSGVFFSGRYWLLFGSSILVITWLNLSNDAYDAETGVDKDKKESVVNITGSGVEALPVTLTVLGASVLVGMTTSLILFCSHFHQIEGDLAVGKMSPLVSLGTEKGSKVVQTAVVSLYTIVALLCALKALPSTCFAFSLLTVPIGK